MKVWFLLGLGIFALFEEAMVEEDVPCHPAWSMCKKGGERPQDLGICCENLDCEVIKAPMKSTDDSYCQPKNEDKNKTAAAAVKQNCTIHLGSKQVVVYGANCSGQIKLSRDGKSFKIADADYDGGEESVGNGGGRVDGGRGWALAWPCMLAIGLIGGNEFRVFL